MHVDYSDAGPGDETTIHVTGVPQAVTLLHVTDSHVTMVDERAAEAMERGTQIREEIATLAGSVPAREHFRRALAQGREIGADCVVLTGDIINFPALVNLEVMAEDLEALPMPYLYTPGNHDWHFPHLPWNDETRAQYSPRLHRFTRSNPAFQVHDAGGVRLVALDNSNYQVDEVQLALLREQLATGLPCLLCMHIPIYLPSLVEAVVAAWDAPIMLAAQGWTPEQQAAWKVRDADPSTLKFHAFLTEEAPPNLLGICCGHVHFAHTDTFHAGQRQWVTRAGFAGGYRVIRIVPR